MKTIINIGTNKKNITNVEIDKDFKDITFKDIVGIVQNRLGYIKDVRIHGWADVTGKNTERNARRIK